MTVPAMLGDVKWQQLSRHGGTGFASTQSGIGQLRDGPARVERGPAPSMTPSCRLPPVRPRRTPYQARPLGLRQAPIKLSPCWTPLTHLVGIRQQGSSLPVAPRSIAFLELAGRVHVLEEGPGPVRGDRRCPGGQSDSHGRVLRNGQPAGLSIPGDPGRRASQVIGRDVDGGLGRLVGQDSARPLTPERARFGDQPQEKLVAGKLLAIPNHRSPGPLSGRC